MLEFYQFAIPKNTRRDTQKTGKSQLEITTTEKPKRSIEFVKRCYQAESFFFN